MVAVVRIWKSAPMAIPATVVLERDGVPEPGEHFDPFDNCWGADARAKRRAEELAREHGATICWEMSS